MSKRSGRKGVSLIELMVVVLILAALSAVAIPRLSQSSQNSKQNACDTNIDMINSAIEMYNADNGAYPNNLVDVIGTEGSPTSYFPDGPPSCPLGGSYTMDASHRVSCSH